VTGEIVHRARTLEAAPARDAVAAGAAQRAALTRAQSADLSRMAWRVLGALQCLVTSYGRTSDRLYSAQIAEAASVGERNVRRGLGELHEAGVIVWGKSGGRHASTITFPNPAPRTSGLNPAPRTSGLEVEPGPPSIRQPGPPVVRLPLRPSTTTPKPSAGKPEIIDAPDWSERERVALDGLGDLAPRARALAELMADGNRTGKARLSRVVRHLYEPLAAAITRCDVTAAALAYGLDAAIRKGAPNANYALNAARSHAKRGEPRPATRSRYAPDLDVYNVHGREAVRDA
jgi:hypothetical protein